MKDPRLSLLFLPKLFFITIVWIPFIYINLKSNNLSNVILLIILYVAVLLLIKKFNIKKEEFKLHNTIFISYIFSGLGFFITFLSIFAIITDYFRHIPPKPISILVTGILLFFSFVLLYFANKSRKYEKIDLMLKTLIV